MAATSRRFRVRVVTSADLTCATVSVSAVTKFDQKSLVEFDAVLRMVGRLSFSRLVVDLTDFEILPADAARALVTLRDQIVSRGGPQLEVVCRPFSAVAMNLRSAGLTSAPQ